MKVHVSFGSWLKRRRRALDLTQQDVADQVGCSVVTIRKIEGNLARPLQADRRAVGRCAGGCTR